MIPQVPVRFPGDCCYGPVTVTTMQSNECVETAPTRFCSFGWQMAFRLFRASGLTEVLSPRRGRFSCKICMWWQIYTQVFSRYSFRAGRGSASLCVTLSQLSARWIVSVPVQSQSRAEARRTAPLEQVRGGRVYLCTTKDFTWTTDCDGVVGDNRAMLLPRHSLVSKKMRVLTTRI